MYLPPDANVAVDDESLSSQPQLLRERGGGRKPILDLLDAEQARLHCTRGIGMFEWAASMALSPMLCWHVPGMCDA